MKKVLTDDFYCLSAREGLKKRPKKDKTDVATNFLF